MFHRILNGLRHAWYFAPGPNDIFLVSFPRSGNTWLRAIFGALTAHRPVASIKDLDRIAPEDEIPIPRYRLERVQQYFIKTHSPYLWKRRDFAEARGLIYIVRDPRDVVLSHYRYLRDLYGYSEDISAFVKDWLSGRMFPGSWVHHVRSWTDSGRARHPRLQVIRFEDLRLDCEDVIKALCLKLSLPFSEPQVHAAVGQATLIEMKKKEARGMRSTEWKPGFSFVNQGAVGKWQSVLSPELLSLIEHDCGDLMARFNYRRTTGGPPILMSR